MSALTLGAEKKKSTSNSKTSHRFPLGLELLQVARQLSDDLRRQVLRYDLVLTRVVVQLVKGRQERPTEGISGETREGTSEEAKKVEKVRIRLKNASVKTSRTF